jgi:hypothetical protein
MDGTILQRWPTDVGAGAHTFGLTRYVLVGHSMGGKVAQLQPWVTRANNCATFVDHKVTLDRRPH